MFKRPIHAQVYLLPVYIRAIFYAPLFPLYNRLATVPFNIAEHSDWDWIRDNCNPRNALLPLERFNE